MTRLDANQPMRIGSAAVHTVGGRVRASYLFDRTEAPIPGPTREADP